jgi:GTP 3',8-cyclase
MSTSAVTSPLVDRFGRQINYLRVSITDRCDFRCIYCMAEDMTFLPRDQVLSLEEIYSLCATFVTLGVRKIRLTGGEPLVRKGAIDLTRRIAALPGLHELTITTNGAQLGEYAHDLHAAGVKRLNISLDTLNPDKFRAITRTGELQRVLDGIETARQAGFERIKLNAVILKNRNHEEAADLLGFALQRNLDISFIEEMPLGIVNDHDRSEAFYPSHELLRDLREQFELFPSTDQSGGPSRYWRTAGARTRVGFISPHSHNFCDRCNRVRLTAEGKLLLCLGNEHAVDLKSVLRTSPQHLRQAIIDAMTLKPEKHHFDIQAQPVIFRHMNATGG